MPYEDLSLPSQRAPQTISVRRVTVAVIATSGARALGEQERRRPLANQLLTTGVAHQRVVVIHRERRAVIGELHRELAGVSAPWWQAAHRVELVDLISVSSHSPMVAG
jgi:hypothetical protein